MTFDHAQAFFRDDRIRDLAKTADGLRYLKLKSLSRREHLERLFKEADLTPTSTGVRGLFREAYNTSSLDLSTIDRTICLIYEEERSERRTSESKLVSHLYPALTCLIGEVFIKTASKGQLLITM